MTIPTVLGFTFAALLFLLTGVFLRETRVWSSGAGPTIAWLCTAVAIALTLVGAASLLCQTTPGRIPRRSAILFSATVVVIAGVGMVVDNWAALDSAAFRISLAEWLGFSALLFVLFEVPRGSVTQAGP